MLTDEFGTRLKYWRKKNGLTQKDLAILSDLQTIAICKYECGANFPTLKTVERLLYALDVSIVDFYSEEINHG